MSHHHSQLCSKLFSSTSRPPKIILTFWAQSSPSTKHKHEPVFHQLFCSCNAMAPASQEQSLGPAILFLKPREPAASIYHISQTTNPSPNTVAGLSSRHRSSIAVCCERPTFAQQPQCCRSGQGCATTISSWHVVKPVGMCLCGRFNGTLV